MVLARQWQRGVPFHFRAGKAVESWNGHDTIDRPQTKNSGSGFLPSPAPLRFLRSLVGCQFQLDSENIKHFDILRNRRRIRDGASSKWVNPDSKRVFKEENES